MHSQSCPSPMEVDQEVPVLLLRNHLPPPAAKDARWARGQTFQVRLTNVEHTYRKNGEQHRLIITEGGRGHVGIFIRPRSPLAQPLPVRWYLMTVFHRDVLGCGELELREHRGIELKADLNANTRWASLAGMRGGRKRFTLLLRIEYPDPDGGPEMLHQEDLSYPIHVTHKPYARWRRVDRRHSARRRAVEVQPEQLFAEHTIYQVLQDESEPSAMCITE